MHQYNDGKKGVILRDWGYYPDIFSFTGNVVRLLLREVRSALFRHTSGDNGKVFMCNCHFNTTFSLQHLANILIQSDSQGCFVSTLKHIRMLV